MIADVTEKDIFLFAGCKLDFYHLPFGVFISSGKVYCCSRAKWGPQEGNVGGERQTYSGVFPQTRATTQSTSHLPGQEPQGMKKCDHFIIIPSHSSIFQVTE